MHNICTCALATSLWEWHACFASLGPAIVLFPFSVRLHWNNYTLSSSFLNWTRMSPLSCSSDKDAALYSRQSLPALSWVMQCRLLVLQGVVIVLLFVVSVFVYIVHDCVNISNKARDFIAVSGSIWLNRSILSPQEGCNKDSPHVIGCW